MATKRGSNDQRNVECSRICVGEKGEKGIEPNGMDRAAVGERGVNGVVSGGKGCGSIEGSSGWFTCGERTYSAFPYPTTPACVSQLVPFGRRQPVVFMKDAVQR